jgi:hypothetical protein
VHSRFFTTGAAGGLARIEPSELTS